MKAILMAMALLAGTAQHVADAHTSHGVDETAAVTIVHDTVPKLVAEDVGFEVGQLDASWSAIAESDVSVIETDGDFHVMRATNPESAAEIFLLIGINGQIIEVKDSNEF